MSGRQARVEIEKRASGLLRVRVLPCERGRRVEARPRRAFINSVESPDSVSGFGSPKKRSTEFGKRSKKLLKEYAAAIEREYTKEHCRFVTATFPTSLETNYEVIAQWTSWITCQINQFLRDLAPNTVSVYCWELQKRGCLHVHYLVANRDKKLLRAISRRFKKFWVRTLRTLSAKSGVDLFATASGGSWRTKASVVRTFVQAVRKSVSAYLAKYLSKGTSKQTTRKELQPVRWWGASQGARSLYERFTKRVESVLLPLPEAQSIAEKLVSVCGAAAVPIFQYTSKWSTGLTAWVVCLSPSVVDEFFDCLLNCDLCTFTECAKLLPAVTDKPPPASLPEAAAFFGGAVVERFGITLRKVPWERFRALPPPVVAWA